MTSLHNQNQPIVSSDEITFTTAFTEGVLAACCCFSETNDLWKKILFNTQNTKLHSLEDIEYLEEEMSRIYHQLSDMELGYELPIDDASSFYDQSSALRDWASGLWVGIEFTGLDKQITDSENVEFIKDIQQIAAMPLSDEIEESGENSQDLFEIQEYCRVATTHLFLTAKYRG